MTDKIKDSMSLEGHAVIFDMDGVITDSERWNVQATIDILKEEGVQICAQELSLFSGRTQEMIWGTLKERFQLCEDVEFYVKQFFEVRDHMLEMTGGVQPMPGVAELIEKLHTRGIPLAIASGSPVSDIEAYMQKLGIRECFRNVVSGCDCKEGKPSPEIYLRAAEAVGYPPEKCIVVEDALNGMKAARAAGMLCVGYVPPTSYITDVSYADVVIQHFDEFKRVFLF